MTQSGIDALAQLHQRYAHLRVAVAHDWLIVQGGAEKVLAALLEAFPQADVFTLVDFMPAKARGRLTQHRVYTSLLQRLPMARRFYRHYLPLMPYAIEQFDLHDYDLVISSSHAVAKGVLTQPDQLHVCYCHTPMRYAWDMKASYLRDAAFSPPLDWYLRRTLKRLRQWDHFTSTQVDHFLANSCNVAARIRKFYGRQASVLPPPVDVEAFQLNTGSRKPYYLAASRLVPYKRLDLIIEAFRREGHRQLKVVGDGPDRRRLERLAQDSSNIELLGYTPQAELQRLMAETSAFIFAADEDFGILPLEAQACGTPVIAYGHGGALETVRGEHAEGSKATGVFFPEQTAGCLLEALACFEQRDFDPLACRQQAEGYSPAFFWQRLQHQLDTLGAL